MEPNEQLRDELLLALDSLSWFEELGEVYNASRARAKVKELRKCLRVSPEPRRTRSAAEQLYDQLDIVLDSLAWFRESGDSRGVADCEDVIREIRARIDELAWQQQQDVTCPVCGRELDKFPHGVKDCAEQELKDSADDFEFRQCLRSL